LGGYTLYVATPVTGVGSRFLHVKNAKAVSPATTFTARVWGRNVNGDEEETEPSNVTVRRRPFLTGCHTHV